MTNREKFEHLTRRYFDAVLVGMRFRDTYGDGKGIFPDDRNPRVVIVRAQLRKDADCAARVENLEGNSVGRETIITLKNLAKFEEIGRA
jgi:hypothetical protein